MNELIEREQTYWEAVSQPRLNSKDMDSGSFATTSIYGWREHDGKIHTKAQVAISCEHQLDCLTGAPWQLTASWDRETKNLIQTS
jgi:hypothetical protein